MAAEGEREGQSGRTRNKKVGEGGKMARGPE